MTSSRQPHRAQNVGWRRALPLAAMLGVMLGLALMVPSVLSRLEPSISGGALQAQGPATVRVFPAEARIDVGAITTLTLRVEDIAELYGADLRIGFDPAIVEVVDSDPTRDGTQIQLEDGFLDPGFVIQDSADNAAGLIWYATTQLNPQPPAEGSGVLAYAVLRGVAGGDAGLRIDFHKLTRRDGTTIDTRAEASPLQVVGAPPPPSPTAPGSSPTASTPSPATPTGSATPDGGEATPTPPASHIHLPFLARGT